MKNNYRIMVVDDEHIVREAISSSIPWEKYQVEVVYAAANAVDALEYLKDHEVDMMLVDIRMPVMDGLELLKQLRGRRADIDFVILSGHADFHYAQQAIHYGAREYLLKPLDAASLLNVVTKCRDERQQKQLMDMMRENPAMNRILANVSDPGNYPQTVGRIIKIVDEEIANEELSLKWISAKKLFLNENYLSRVFQKETGQRFSSYLAERRMLLAMQKLAYSPEEMILDVARATGFGDNSQYFSSTFKKFTGYTPSEYRRYMREGKFK
ncbi:response regulator [Lachnotalea sp. AF33-28]|uniref:response regulator n=1 Tax=Lachnotalea sp. AF33-28 TaxID=2292046 RepID=UPI001313F768|nr:response regulator [Lachnotalea sp. AF33-28]